MTAHESHQKTPNEWWACERPESLPTQWTIYDDDCRACVLAMGAHTLAGDEDLSVLGLWEPSSAVYEKYRHKHGLPPLPEVSHA